MANGLLNTSQLTDVGGGKLLRSDAARQWLALVAACFAATGVRLTLTEGYRNLARQTFLYLGWIRGHKGFNVASIPGRSNHGLGIDVDIGNYGSAAVWAWLLANADDYGWSWAQGKASGERWHWVYVGGETITAATNTTPLQAEEDEDMPRIIYTVQNAFAVLEPGSEPYLIPETPEGLERVAIILGHNPDAIYGKTIPAGVVRVASQKNWEVEVREARYRAAKNRDLLAAVIVASSR